MGTERRLLALLICLLLGGGLTGAVLGATRAAEAARPVEAAGTAHSGAAHSGTEHSGTAAADRPAPGDFVDIRDVPPGPADPPPGPGGSAGTVTVDCGRDEEGHYNEDNLVVSPGLRAGAHHTHAYVGNLSTDAMSTDDTLAAAATSCRGGDRSTYYWPVLRRPDRPAAHPREGAAGHGNAGAILPEAAVSVEFLGNPVSQVVAMPRFLRAMTGDPVAATAADDADVRARWGCSGTPDRSTTRYPRCPAGRRLTRTLVFPSCWNGLDTASFDHRSHLVFPGAGGICPQGTFAVPRLRISLAYDVPPGAPVSLDSFPEQRHSPKTDHAMFVNVMTDAAMAGVVSCLNSGRHC
ncbi:DUF1996 domain-containing protein [Streptomyces sp. NBC_00536]|uniref:DUF1996 domain-containing protein n=1 Tax=Streptomyces sp. NBC_00536 TaxID=2975769 RepID=UPI002E807DA2|nr:DUF1996 domain-containing protein [Streptomyces sp. NBC_00536]WUC82753.1 DUF1996 domain-containing protein [Streptomyces sp. NBC_00536]